MHDGLSGSKASRCAGIADRTTFCERVLPSAAKWRQADFGSRRRWDRNTVARFTTRAGNGRIVRLKY